ncbi:hypothetical protein SNE40_016113 [Patella caerulea]|uniref:Uncharacterized protein n=1 Tax=Patella caerulea TaxID=87958 RepID=A0AAN8JCK0_PATCE
MADDAPHVSFPVSKAILIFDLRSSKRSSSFSSNSATSFRLFFVTAYLAIDAPAPVTAPAPPIPAPTAETIKDAPNVKKLAANPPIIRPLPTAPATLPLTLLIRTSFSILLSSFAISLRRATSFLRLVFSFLEIFLTFCKVSAILQI